MLIDDEAIFQYYSPPSSNAWAGRVDNDIPERFHQVIKLRDLTEESIAEDEVYSFVLVGFCCDEGIRRNQGRVGARTGPDVLRSSLANLPFNHAHNINIYDVGNIHCHDGNLESAQTALGLVIEHILLSGCHPIVLGGGHETAWGHYQGIANTTYAETLGIINFDAHFDLRPLLDGEYGTSGTPFTQIALDREANNLSFDYFCLGIQPMANTLSLYEEAEVLEVDYIEAQELSSLNEHTDSEERDALIDFINNHETIYVSICLDVFSNAVAPGVSAPQPLGVMPQVVLPIIRFLANSNKVISLDVVELAPNYDQDNHTARLGAQLIADYINMACL